MSAKPKPEPTKTLTLTATELTALYRNLNSEWTVAKHIWSVKQKVTLALVDSTSPATKAKQYEEYYG